MVRKNGIYFASFFSRTSTREENMKKRSFDWRSFVTFLVALSAFVLFISGLILYIAPSGKVAHWTNWKILLNKDQWTDIHVVFSVLFTLAVAFHLFSFNWKVFKNFIKKRGVALGSALLISSLLFVGTYYSVPPLVYLREFSDYMKDYWEGKEKAPPIPHAEELTLKEAAEDYLKISAASALQTLKKKGLQVGGPEETLKEIAEKNGLSPLELYSLISEGAAYDSKPLRGGFGRMTLKKAAMSLGISPKKARNILEKNGIKVSSEDITLREIGQANGLTPREVYELLEKTTK